MQKWKISPDVLTVLPNSKLAASYKGRFADASRMLASQTLQHRSWISDRWTDTESGSGKEIKMLEYACGPGVVSMVCATPYLS